ncbi:MAG: FtsX-like permease family protein [Myxococcota bacterium]
MGRFVAILSVLALGVLCFAGALATADLDTRYYTLVGTQLFVVIVGVVVVSSLFTVLYLVVFGRVGRQLIEDRFSLFVSWTLARSHRVTPTRTTRLWQIWRGLIGRSRREGGKLLLVGCALVAAGLLLEHTAIWNRFAGQFSAGFARTFQLMLYLIASPLLLGGLLSTLLSNESIDIPWRLRVRNAVTLPTFISIVGVSIGLWALIVVLSVMHGFESDLRDKILRTNAHIVIEPEEAAGVVGDYLSLTDRLRDIPAVSEVQAFAHGEVMMASSSNIAVNVIVKGMAPADLEASEQLAGRISPGSAAWLTTPEKLLSDRSRYPLRPRKEGLLGLSSADVKYAAHNTAVVPAILLGAELALSLGVEVGNDIQLISPDGDVGPTGLRPKLRSFRVGGIFRTGMYEYDQKMAYVNIVDAQRFFGLGADVNRAELRLTSATHLDDVRAEVDAALAASPTRLVAADWRERNKSLFSALQLERFVMFIVLGFIVLVASLLIVSSLVMLIVEKAREIAVLKALGASGGRVVRVFLLIGAVIGGIGSASGVTLGVATCLAIEAFGIPLPQEYYITELPVDLDWGEVAIVGLSGFLVCILATIYPSREASGLKPVEGLRHG